MYAPWTSILIWHGIRDRQWTCRFSIAIAISPVEIWSWIWAFYVITMTEESDTTRRYFWKCSQRLCVALVISVCVVLHMKLKLRHASEFYSADSQNTFMVKRGPKVWKIRLKVLNCQCPFGRVTNLKPLQ